MLQLLVAPLSGIEFQSSPLQSSRVHKRAEVRSAGQNLRLCPLHMPFLSRDRSRPRFVRRGTPTGTISWTTSGSRGPAKCRPARCGSQTGGCWRVALMPGLLRAGGPRRAGQLRQERQPLEPSGRLHQGRRGACGGCAPRMCAAPAFPALCWAPVPPHTQLFSAACQSHADELKRNFVDKLTSLRLRLSSHTCGQTHAPAQRPASHRGLWRGLPGAGCAAVHIVLHSGWSCERQPHPTPAPCRAHISAPQVPHGRCVSSRCMSSGTQARGRRLLARRGGRHAPRHVTERSHRAVGRAFAFRLARAAARAPLLGLHPAALYHGITIHPAASTMQAGAYARLCHPFGRTRARYASSALPTALPTLGRAFRITTMLLTPGPAILSRRALQAARQNTVARRRQSDEARRAGACLARPPPATAAAAAATAAP